MKSNRGANKIQNLVTTSEYHSRICEFAARRVDIFRECILTETNLQIITKKILSASTVISHICNEVATVKTVSVRCASARSPVMYLPIISYIIVAKTFRQTSAERAWRATDTDVLMV